MHWIKIKTLKPKNQKKFLITLRDNINQPSIQPFQPLQPIPSNNELANQPLPNTPSTEPISNSDTNDSGSSGPVHDKELFDPTLPKLNRNFEEEKEEKEFKDNYQPLPDDYQILPIPIDNNNNESPEPTPPNRESGHKRIRNFDKEKLEQLLKDEGLDQPPTNRQKLFNLIIKASRLPFRPASSKKMRSVTFFYFYCN